MVIFHRFLYVYQRDNPITTRKAAGAEQRAPGHDRHGRHRGAERSHGAELGGAVHHGQLETWRNIGRLFHYNNYSIGISLVGIVDYSGL